MKRESRAITSHHLKTSRSVTLWPQGVIPCDLYPCKDHTCVAFWLFFPLLWVLLAGSCGQNWSEGKMMTAGWSGETAFESSHRVVTCSGTNRWGSSGQTPTMLMVCRDLTEFGLTRKQRADRAPEPLLQASCFCCTSQSSPRIQRH